MTSKNMNNTMIKRKVIKIAFLGDVMTGKTELLHKYLKFDDFGDKLATIGVEKLERLIKLDNGEEKKLILWDTSGAERFHSIALKSIKVVNGYIIVFDLTSKKSFENVVFWLDEIKAMNNCPIVLFGNKCDLNEKRTIRKEEAEEFALKNNLPYFETSAKINININEGISKIANMANEYRINNNFDINLKKDNKNKKQKKSKNKKDSEIKENYKNENNNQIIKKELLKFNILNKFISI